MYGLDTEPVKPVGPVQDAAFNYRSSILPNLQVWIKDHSASGLAVSRAARQGDLRGLRS